MAYNPEDTFYLYCLDHQSQSKGETAADFRFDSTPLLEQIRSFPMLDGNPMDLAEQMPDYSGFSICILQDKGNHLEMIKRSSGSQIQDILNQVFRDWLNGKGKKPVSWKTLIQCLQSSGYNELMKKIKVVLGESVACYIIIISAVVCSLLLEAIIIIIAT